MIPLSKRAKQIVKQHGERWEVVRRQPYVLFSAEHRSLHAKRVMARA